MKRSFRGLFGAAVTALLLCLAPSVVAPLRGQAPAQAQQEAERAALYQKFLDNRTGSAEQQRLAYETANEYLQKYPAPANDEAQLQLRRYLEGWVGRYEAAARIYYLDEALAAGNFPRTFEIGRRILAADSLNQHALASLIAAAQRAMRAGDRSFNAEAAGYARKAARLLESGKPDSSGFFNSNQDEALGFYQYAAGSFLVSSAPAEAVPLLRRAAASNSSYAREPSTYYYLGAAISNGEYAALSRQYNDTYAGKEPTPAAVELLGRLNALLDRIIDAYARAVALSTKPEQQTFRGQVMAQLTPIYRARHANSEAGLNELIASVLSKPLP